MEFMRFVYKHQFYAVTKCAISILKVQRNNAHKRFSRLAICIQSKGEKRSWDETKKLAFGNFAWKNLLKEEKLFSIFITIGRDWGKVNRFLSFSRDSEVNAWLGKILLEPVTESFMFLSFQWQHVRHGIIVMWRTLIKMLRLTTLHYSIAPG